MKKFEFPMARVAKWSQQKLSSEKLALLGLIQERAELDQRLSHLQQVVTEGFGELQREVSVTGRELCMMAEYLRELGRVKESLWVVRLDLQKKIEGQRQRVVAEHKRVRVFDHLEGKFHSEWLRELSREENSIASDLFLASVARDLTTPNISGA